MTMSDHANQQLFKPLPDARLPLMWKPDDIVMHPKQYNRLIELMRARKQGDKTQTTWNGVPVHVSNNMPEGGWFIVPGYDQ